MVRSQEAYLEPWKDDLMHAFHTIECERQVFAMVAELARGLEFDYCTYGLRTPIPLTRPKTAMYSNYPLAWQTIYQEKDTWSLIPRYSRLFVRCPPFSGLTTFLHPRQNCGRKPSHSGYGPG